jgi:4-amino-4-deoxy-L-arabinose transferase-like glycosyltransferase
MVPYRGRDLAAITLLALCVRITYLVAALQSQDLVSVAKVASDSHVYTQLAEHWRSGLAVEERFLLVAGPGYPALLAGLAGIFGSGLWPPVILNLLLGALAPVAVYLLAASLLASRTVAVVSGLLVALSFTGLSMSTSLLTDQPFYTLHAFGLLVFLRGLQSGRTRWFVVAGVLSTVATAIRPLGQLWPAVMLLLALGWVLKSQPPRNWRLLARSLWSPALMLAFLLAWSIHNEARHGIFTVTTNGVRATWAYLAATAVADHTPGGNFDSVRTAWSQDVHRPAAGLPPSEAEIHRRMKSRVLDVLREHPRWLLESFAVIVWRNLRASNHFAEAQVPQWKPIWSTVRNLSHDWINPLLLVASVLALASMLLARQWLSALLLGLTYAYFTLMAGFSFWQGSRLHFPAEMAWSILVSYFGVLGWRRLVAVRYRRDAASSV